MKVKEEVHCVQCGEKVYLDEFDVYYVCQQEDCPNYGLLQVGIENMPIDKD